jgi:hypothetical protein
LEDFGGQDRIGHDTRFPSMVKGYLGRLGLSSIISPRGLRNLCITGQNLSVGASGVPYVAS